MTTVNDIADILRIIREQPEWADALRAALLSKDLLDLPQRLAEFAAAAEKRFATLETNVADLKAGQARLEAGQSRLEGDVTELKAGQTRLEGDVTELKAGQSRLEADVTELKAGQARLEGDVTELKAGQARLEGDVTELKAGQSRQEGIIGNFRGTYYELKIGNNIASIINQHMNLRRIRVLKGSRAPDDMAFLDLLLDAEDQSIITEQERAEATNVDIVLQAQTHPEQSRIYIVIEISVTIANHDINRAAARADILRKATGEAAIPAVIGAHSDEARHQLALEHDVTLITVNE